eukprot:1156598-Pelagomonas_calceolata.AAC.1
MHICTLTGKEHRKRDCLCHMARCQGHKNPAHDPFLKQGLQPGRSLTQTCTPAMYRLHAYERCTNERMHMNRGVLASCVCTALVPADRDQSLNWHKGHSLHCGIYITDRRQK